MANDLELLIKLLPWLVANNGVSLSQVANHFEISDKHALELISQLVVTGPSQAGGGLVDIDFEDADSIFVSDAKALDRPVKLTEFEASSLLGGLHYLEQFPNLVNSETVAGLIIPGTKWSGVMNYGHMRSISMPMAGMVSYT